MSDQTRIMSSLQLFCYGFLTTPIAVAGFALVIYIPTFYAVDMGLGLAAVGAVFMFGRVFDVISDPLIGYLSDRTGSRYGPRLPWIVLGLPGLVLSVWLLLSPPEGAGLWYLICVSAAFFLFFTIVDVPYSSVGLEISPNTNERTYLAGSKAAFQVGGALIASLVPILFAAQMGASLHVLALIVVGFSIPAILIFMFGVPRAVQNETLHNVGLLEASLYALRHRDYRLLIGAFFLVQAGNALTAGLMVLFITQIVGRPDLIGHFFLLLFASTAIFLPVWIWLSIVRSKTFSWACAISVACLSLALACLIGPGQIWPMAGLSIVIGAAFGADATMPTSMLADIVSKGESEGQPKRAAMLLALKNAVSKLTFVFPMGLAFPVLELAGLDKVGSNSPIALLTVVFFFAALPILLRLLALLVLSKTVRSKKNGNGINA